MNPAALPSAARLLNRRDFDRVFAARQAVSNRYFRVHWAATEGSAANGARIGLAIAKRIARRAIDRNRLKRLARESFRQQRRGLKPLDFIVLARSDAVSADNTTLRQALDQLWVQFESP
jgi:ribonuclease P protein component